MSQAGSTSSGGGGGSGILSLSYKLVTTTPYTVLSTDSFLGVDTTTLAISILLPNTTSTGRVIVIKDIAGLCPTNNITITTVGGVVLIDNAATFVMNSAFESVQVLFDGTEYLVF